MKQIMLIVLFALGVVGPATVLSTPIIAAPASPFGHVEQYSSCGIKPIKPIRPIGCDDLVAQCQCDSNGRQCSWVWVCVKR